MIPCAEGGRTTVDGIQWIRIGDGSKVPVSDTEFARDPTFGYRSQSLPRQRAASAPGSLSRALSAG